MEDGGRIILKTDQGDFIALAGGGIAWDDKTTSVTPMGTAPAVAIWALAEYCIIMAWMACNGCGGSEVAGATAALGWSMVMSDISGAMTDLEYLANSIAKGASEPVYE